MPVRDRPLSPHLQVYRWQMGNTLSILHRVTGVSLSLGLVALTYWLMSLAGGRDDYESALRVFYSPLGMLVVGAWIFSFLYHLLNGLRHLCWDAGYGFEQPARRVNGWAVVIGAVVGTVAVCLYAWRGWYT